MAFHYGDKIIYEYEHALNSVSRVTRRKIGKYIGMIKHTYKHWQKHTEQMVAVELEGNKNITNVPLSAIRAQ